MTEVIPALFVVWVDCVGGGGGWGYSISKWLTFRVLGWGWGGFRGIEFLFQEVTNQIPNFLNPFDGFHRDTIVFFQLEFQIRLTVFSVRSSHH